MAPPAFLASSFRYLQVLGETDVANIITNFRSETVTNGVPPWTEPVANTFRSPVDADGRFMEVILAVTSPTRLNFNMKNNLGVAVPNATKEIQISGAGTTIRFYTGQYHAWIEAVEATPECLGADIHDLSPEAQSSYGDGYSAFAYRNNGGGAEQTSWRQRWVATSNLAACMLYQDNGGGSNLKTPTAAYIFQPVMIERSDGIWIGRQYQAFTCSSDFANGVEVLVPIDVATLGTFKIIGNGAINTRKMCLRIA